MNDFPIGYFGYKSAHHDDVVAESIELAAEFAKKTYYTKLAEQEPRLKWQPNSTLTHRLLETFSADQLCAVKHDHQNCVVQKISDWNTSLWEYYCGPTKMISFLPPEWQVVERVLQRSPFDLSGGYTHDFNHNGLISVLCLDGTEFYMRRRFELLSGPLGLLTDASKTVVAFKRHHIAETAATFTITYKQKFS